MTSLPDFSKVAFRRPAQPRFVAAGESWLTPEGIDVKAAL